METQKKPIIIGIAGGSGSGKTTIAMEIYNRFKSCLLYTSPSPRDGLLSRMPSSA